MAVLSVSFAFRGLSSGIQGFPGKRAMGGPVGCAAALSFLPATLRIGSDARRSGHGPHVGAAGAACRVFVPATLCR